MTFYVRRKENQLLGTVILPAFIIALISAFSTAIPASSGEKLGFLITLLLSQLFFLHHVEYQVSPVGYNDYPIILYVLLAALVILAYSVMQSLLFQLFDQTKAPPKPCLTVSKFLTFVLCKNGCNSINSNPEADEQSDDEIR